MSDIKFELKVGDYEVFQSGSVVLNAQHPVTFVIADLTFELVFMTSEDKKTAIKAQPDGNKKLTIELYNYDNSLGTVQIQPIEFATLSDGHKVFFQYAIYGIGTGLKVLHYTWYLLAAGKN